jgi:glycosyltransferase involved in cell wall biosynthesis
MADFRDPWTDIDYFHQLPLTKKAKNKHFNLEKKVLTNADKIIVVGKTMQENYLKFNKNTFIITNGFDTFNTTESISLDNKFSLLHIGMLNNDRNHEILWNVLAEILQENKTFAKNLEIKLIGKVCEEAIESIRKNDLSTYLNHLNYIKHQEVVKHQKSAQVLVLLINNVPSAKGIITGKIFEYLQAKRPILAIAPTNGDLAEIIKNTNSGTVIDFDDTTKLKKTILSLHQEFQNNNLMVRSKNIEQYHRKELTKELVNNLKS